MVKNFRIEDLSYLAGYFEGEGTIFFNSNLAPLVGIKVQTGDKEIIEQFSKMFGGPVTKSKPTNYMAKRQIWRWEANGKGAQEVIAILAPYFKGIAKQELAMLASVPTYGNKGKSISQDERILRFLVAARTVAVNNRVTL